MARKVVGPDLLTPAEVAALYGVDVKTVTRWANAGFLTTIRTPGNHRRYDASEIQGLLSRSRQKRRRTS